MQTLPVTLSSHTSCKTIIRQLISKNQSRNSETQKKTAQHLVPVVERHWPREQREYVLLGEIPVPLGRHQIEQILVVARKLRLPDGVGGGSAAKRAIEAREVAYLRRSKVEENAGDATLRDVAEARSGGRTVGS